MEASSSSARRALAAAALPLGHAPPFSSSMPPNIPPIIPSGPLRGPPVPGWSGLSVRVLPVLSCLHEVRRRREVVVPHLHLCALVPAGLPLRYR